MNKSADIEPVSRLYAHPLEQQCKVRVVEHRSKRNALASQIWIKVDRGQDAHIKQVYWQELVAALLAPWRRLMWTLLSLLLVIIVFCSVVDGVHVVMAAAAALASSFIITILGYVVWYPILCGRERKDQRIVSAAVAWNEQRKAAARWLVECHVRTFQPWHLDWFLQRMVNQPEQITPILPLFPNTKEMTESAAAFRAIDCILALSNTREAQKAAAALARQDSSKHRYLVVVVGDGATCRTASLFAALGCGRCDVHSVDPTMHANLLSAKDAPPIRHLAAHIVCHKSTIEEWLEAHLEATLEAAEYNHIVLVAVHSHALFPAYVPRVCETARAHKQQPQVLLVAIPCCVPQEFSCDELKELRLESIHEKEDWGIMSNKRRVCVWQSRR